MPKTIITCAITGAVHTPTMSEHLPVHPDTIAEQAIAAAEAGAAVIHLHARNPANGAPSVDPAHFELFLSRIKQATDAVINISTGGNPVMTVAERIPAAKTFSPEMCSLNMGSMNFALHPLAERYQAWKEDWEEGYIRSSENNIFRNTFAEHSNPDQSLNDAVGRFGHRVRPLIEQHPVTGRAFLNFNEAFVTHIKGLTTNEANSLKTWLANHMNRPELQVRWRWQAGDLAMWDNRVTMHYAVADYLPAYRCMNRVTVVHDRRVPN